MSTQRPSSDREAERLEAVATAKYKQLGFAKPWDRLPPAVRAVYRREATDFLAMLDAARRFPIEPPEEGR